MKVLRTFSLLILAVAFVGLSLMSCDNTGVTHQEKEESVVKEADIHFAPVDGELSTTILGTNVVVTSGPSGVDINAGSFEADSISVICRNTNNNTKREVMTLKRALWKSGELGTILRGDTSDDSTVTSIYYYYGEENTLIEYNYETTDKSGAERHVARNFYANNQEFSCTHVRFKIHGLEARARGFSFNKDLKYHKNKVRKE